MFSGGAGSEERGFTSLRYGGHKGKDLNWRVYGKQFDRDNGYLPGDEAYDDCRMAQGGFRMDYTPSACDTFTLQGDVYNGDQGVSYRQQFATPPFQRMMVDDTRLSGGNILGRWTRELDDDRGWAVQFYYDRMKRLSDALNQIGDTIDIDYQRHAPLGSRHKLVWGAGYRHWRGESLGSFSFAFDPDLRKTDLFSYFIQDEISLSEDFLSMIVQVV